MTRGRRWGGTGCEMGSGGCEWRRLAGTPVLARQTGSRSHGHGETDKMLRWLFKQVNWPGRQRDRDRWME